MGGYRGDGYGIHGQYGDDDYNEETRQAREEMREDMRDRYEDRYGRDDPRRYRGNDRFMFGRSDRGERDDDSGRGFFERARNETSSWFSDEDDRSGHNRDSWRAADRYRERYGMQGHEGQYGREPDQNRGWHRQDRSGGFSGSSQDDHYRSWRDRQMQELDRDYQDYCREREQQFHQDFDSWRRNRSSISQRSQSTDQPGSGEGYVVTAESETLILTDSTPGSAGGQSGSRQGSQAESGSAGSEEQESKAGRSKS